MPTKELRKLNAKRNWFVLTSLVSKDFKLRYRRSALGVAWSVLNPLLMMVVLSAVFSFMFRFSIENFPLYLILGNTVFALMSDSTTQAMSSIIDAAPLIKKVRVEKMIFPFEKILFCLLNFLISLIAVAIVMVYYQIFPTVNVLFLPLFLFYMILFCSGLGLLLSSLSVFFRDIVHLWTVVITAWTYATPLFYPVDMLPDWTQTVMLFNPMYHFVTYFRDIMMWNITPSLELNLLCLTMGIVMFLIGMLVFRRVEKKFVLFI